MGASLACRRAAQEPKDLNPTHIPVPQLDIQREESASMASSQKSQKILV